MNGVFEYMLDMIAFKKMMGRIMWKSGIIDSCFWLFDEQIFWGFSIWSVKGVLEVIFFPFTVLDSFQQ